MKIFKKTILYGSLITSIVVSGLFFSVASPAKAADCTVTSATIDPYTDQGGFAQDGFFINSIRLTKNKVLVRIRTQDCAGKNISVSLTGYRDSLSDFTGGFLSGFTEDLDVLNDRDFVVPASEQLDINLVAGEEACKKNALPWNNGIAGYSDCQFYVSVSTGLLSSNYSSRDKLKGNLDYECEGGCDEDIKWLYAGDTSEKPTAADPASIPPKNTTLLTNDVAENTSKECLGSDGKPIEGCYQLYGGFEEILTRVGLKNSNSIGDFINAIIALAIGVAGIITVGMIMFDGFAYWRAEKEGNVSGLGKVKGTIWKRLLGLLLLFTIYTILRTINPDLLNLTPRINSVAFKTGGDTETASPDQPSVDIKQKAADYGISCPGNGGTAAIPTIAQSFIGKVTYQYGAKGSAGPNNTLNYDCSGFVGAVYTCAGLPSPGGGTGGIFSGKVGITSLTPTLLNSKSLTPGDLLGWTAGSMTGTKQEEAGHVVMYIGNGKAIESTSNNQGKNPGKAVQVRAADAYTLARLKFFKKAP